MAGSRVAAGAAGGDARRTAAGTAALRLRVQRMFALLVELILQFQAGVVGFHCFDRLYDRIHPPLHLIFAQLFRGRGAFAGIMEGEARVPPDTGIDAFGETLAVLVGAGFVRRAPDRDDAARRSA